jgi:hypothetical protein
LNREDFQRFVNEESSGIDAISGIDAESLFQRLACPKVSLASVALTTTL